MPNEHPEEDFEARMEKLRSKIDALKSDLPPADFDETFKAGLDRIAEKAEGSQPEMPEPPEWEFKRPKIPGQFEGDAASYLGLGVGLSVAYTLVGCSVLGWGLGWWADRGSGAFLFQAIGTLVGSVVGLVGSIFMILRAQRK